MNIDLPRTTRVWIYQSNRPFSAEETTEISIKATAFARRWVSHNQQLKSAATVFHNRFLVLMVDESQAGASGCSIDSSVAFVKQLQAAYGVDFFDRMRFSYQDNNGEVHTISREDFAKEYQAGKITDETLVFDTLVKNKEELDSRFLKPLQDSWHARMV
jgi:hypothetical protein